MNKIARLFRDTGPLRFLLPVGIVLIIFGIFMLKLTPQKYEQTTGTITAVTETLDTTDDVTRTVYDVEFDYTVDGKVYHSSFSGLSDRPAEGDRITVYYDPADPSRISNTKSTGLIGIILIIIGVICIAGGIFSAVKLFGKSRRLDEQIRQASGGSEPPRIAPPPKEQQKEYYISFDGHSLKPGYVMEDGERNVVYEAAMTKNALVGSRLFTFTNHVTGESAEHEVGHTVTSSFDNEVFSTSSWFKFDGKNVWDVIHEQGVRINTDVASKFPNLTYVISKNGRYFATAQTSGRFVHEEDAAEHKLNIPVGKYFYRVWTNESDLDLIMLTVFAISETEQTFVE